MFMEEKQAYGAECSWKKSKHMERKIHRRKSKHMEWDVHGWNADIWIEKGIEKE